MGDQTFLNPPRQWEGGDNVFKSELDRITLYVIQPRRVKANNALTVHDVYPHSLNVVFRIIPHGVIEHTEVKAI